jgi:mycofactocin precursor
MTDARTAALPTTEKQTPIGEAVVDVTAGDRTGAAVDALTSELLVEEVSIDGMCGVY